MPFCEKGDQFCILLSISADVRHFFFLCPCAGKCDAGRPAPGESVECGSNSGGVYSNLSSVCERCTEKIVHAGEIALGKSLIETVNEIQFSIRLFLWKVRQENLG